MLAILYTKSNKYSFNALLGALEAAPEKDLVDVVFYQEPEKLLQGIARALDEWERVILAVSFFSTQLWETADLMQRVRCELGPRIFAMAGGSHPTGDPWGTLRLGFDAVVCGEGEDVFPKIVGGAVTGCSIKDLQGVVTAAEVGDESKTRRAKPVDLDNYAPFSMLYRKLGPIEISRGCPYVCSYCQTPFIFGTQQRHRSLDTVISCVQKLSSVGFKDIRFITPNSFSYGSADGKTPDVGALEKLLSGVLEASQGGRVFLGSFPSEVRPDHVTRETVALVVKYASNDNLVIGAQAGSQRILDKCHRGHTVEDIYTSVRLTREAGLKANVDFIFQLPGEGPEDVRATVRVMQDLINMGAKIHAHTFMPLPQTPFALEWMPSVTEELEAFLREKVPAGVIYGNWKEQAELAVRMRRYLRTGQLH